ncbi:alpha/beta hydrolase family protein [Aspergillus fijiensis CBS 313.89]|uniref:Alpha/beta-hydrolase n=1 Tax=Aspergillus fijiensis CBS 313.89 TaxID=1448319 RepID=A0A8G1RM55_9EURO|nr:alpha/beta-hydrolase [Aspergillus fijiensis CBS 313.89]RAK75208.1 alpha/beta-hydrolase [Aspergillus fijiensis CBS 313.89]
MHQFFPSSSFFNFEFTRVVGTIPFGGAELAECLDAATQITGDDAESWHRGWLVQAEKAHAIALEAAEHGDRHAARDAFLRAANYFRASQYMFDDRRESPEPRVRELFARSVQAFHSATPLLGHRTHILQVPYREGHLPGYLFLPPLQGGETARQEPGATVPVVVCINGADSTSEELYLLYGASGCQRGYAVLLVDGPGQGASLRETGTAMRPDWEQVTRPVLDYVEHLARVHPEWRLDLSRIALAGVSMGAYYALRGAVDPRVAACIAIDPFYDMFDLATSRMPPWFIRAWLAGWITDGAFDATWRMLSRWNFQLKWELTHVMWIFGKDSPAAAMREMQRYSLKGDGKAGEYLRLVECPVMISGAAQTIYTAPEISTLRIAQALDHLPDERRHLWIAREAGDGGLQGKVGAWRLLQQKVFQFLDEQWDVKRSIGGLQG